jgi:leader peptidase (prepilin peptidase) / N-methyltransferase
MLLFFFVCLFVLIGLSLGSFVNVLIVRLRADRSIVRGRSACVHCHHKLSVLDLIPVLSFVMLRGRCRYCDKRFSIQYPLVEGVIGLLFGVYAWQFASRGFEYALSVEGLALLVFQCVATAVLVLIFVYDLRHYLILDVVTYPAIVVALLVDIFIFHISLQLIAYSLLAGAGLFFVLVSVSGGRWMGWGDVKLGALIALLVPWPHILFVLFFSFILGSIVGALLLAQKKKTLKDAVPFGTFLAASSILYFLFRESVVYHEIVSLYIPF